MQSNEEPTASLSSHSTGHFVPMFGGSAGWPFSLGLKGPAGGSCVTTHLLGLSGRLTQQWLYSHVGDGASSSGLQGHTRFTGAGAERAFQGTGGWRDRPSEDLTSVNKNGDIQKAGTARCGRWEAVTLAAPGWESSPLLLDAHQLCVSGHVLAPL